MINDRLPERYTVCKLLLIKKERNSEYLNMSSLRPIQINPVMIKILEKVIINRLKQENNLLNKRQKGFKPKSSTHEHIKEII